MPTLSASDRTELAYQVMGAGKPVITLPGGPMQSSAYLGDLGGLPGRVQLIVGDLRGTGKSAVPADPASYRCDRLTGDVSALADHLGLQRFGLLGHSAGANIAVQFAASHPERISKLALITPSTRAVDLAVSSDARRDIVSLRRGEPWFAAAAAAFERIQVDGGNADDWDGIVPFTYGRWDAAAQAHSAARAEQTNEDAADVFSSEGAFDPAATRAALATLGVPVLILAGEVDIVTPPSVAAEYAALFPDARVVVQPGGGHMPWLDDPSGFVSAVAAFLA